MPEVSVIIPVYKVEDIVARCARSLFEQTLHDIEFIFVDDHSPDDSMEVIREILSDYPNRESQVRFISLEENLGQAKVRKIGVEAATGDYVIHCDSDDWMELDMLESMYSKAVQGNHDIVFCDFYIDEEGQNSRVWKQNVREDSDVISQMMYSATSVTLWSKLVRREHAMKPELVWPTSNMGEDFALSFQYICYSDSVGYVDVPLYHYIRRSESISNRKCFEDRLISHDQFCDNFNLVLDFLKTKGQYDNHIEEIVHRALNLKNFYLPKVYQREYYHLWKDSYPFVNKHILTAKKVTLKEKILFLLTYTGGYGLRLSIMSKFIKKV